MSEGGGAGRRQGACSGQDCQARKEDGTSRESYRLLSTRRDRGQWVQRRQEALGNRTQDAALKNSVQS